MKNTKNKTIATIALATLLVFSAILVVLPVAFSQEPPIPTKQTYAILDFIPNPIGEGQDLLITYGITDFTVRPQMGWEDLTIEIAKPDGTKEILGPLKTDTTGLSGTLYTPTMVGTYTLQTHFPQQLRTVEQPGRVEAPMIMLASSSEISELIVQEEPIEYYPGQPLPNEYWNRPIDAQLREWYNIAGNWVYGKSEDPSKFAPYNEFAPETPHILWTRPYDNDGGLAGGSTGVYGFECGDAYEGKFDDSIIIGGVLYYNRRAWGFGGMEYFQGVYAVDLHTGEELWFQPDLRIHKGQQFYFDSFNFHGVYSYLWSISGSTWRALDAATGEWLYTFENVPGGIEKRGPNGEILRYTVNTGNGRMTMWNSTKCGQQDLTGGDLGSWGRMVHLEKTFDASNPKCFEWNVTIPTDLPGSAKVVVDGEMVIGSNTAGSTGEQQPNPEFWAISIKPGSEGQLLWQKSWPLPLPDVHVDFPAGFVPTAEDGVFLVAVKEVRQYYGFSIDTGLEIWGPTDMLAPLTAFSIVYPAGNVWGQGCSAYGKLVVGGMGGEVACYDIKTGVENWRYELTDPYQEILWSNLWPAIPIFITDGKVYVSTTEHSVIDPKPRGGPFICLDIETGEEIFRVDGMMRTSRWGGQHLIGDSIIAGMDTYDNRIYAIGKGPSATTVVAAPKVVALGTSVLVEGSVTDESPGTKSPELALRFPNGLPAVADEDMGDWMLYVYKQFPRPEDANGVSVKIEAVDPNGNYVNLGTTTTDCYGNYGFSFKPDTEGNYMIIATFEGSESYWSSSATTYIAADAAPPTPQPSPTPAPSPTPSPSPLPSPGPGEPAAPINMYLIAAAVAVVAVIVAAAIFLRKRK